MDKQIGFIGCGNMATAMIQGMLANGIVKPGQIAATAVTDETIDDAAEKYEIDTTHDNKQVASESDILFLAIKPYLYEGIIQEIRSYVKEDAVIITIAAGITLDKMKNSFDHKVKVVRSMPNTPSLVGEGMSVLCPNDFVEEDEMEEVIRIFESFGKAEIIKEELMDAIPAISGSAPAYVYMFIEAMADAAVQQKIPRQQAYKLASQAVLGAAKMVLETGEHPGKLKDDVCTPGGSTIEAVTTLESENFRNAVIKAMDACTKRARALSNE
ncbi:pyrroline-5-carboxylate reductase [Thalassobacillus pellis]|uniref:pyrroline-5-carboxylate reductase n=1 Tax=Thalassobacillus pellis TaxID=748008 RepID=UPI00195FF6F3|nr:pyrroline-5-carboxylate reductase [Thalassobacillus pellis]MBM7551215.1 pyrroline-5-carboxylate reductase [Thalassobacillus pellis]